ncbi:hypothetical protein L198_07024 [Cryptococcus wingfieldii CBS 7118]|uniref:Uncharacterized protein n=1 Tax=Cryptococcus wingfieldii CBS 7118 TaxID=1295528 RepID=A0A1E3IFM4_9TREE|nr:hypothetical protein L198_07024 [Cryptococcus wingfieldii CBS 7118]ODN87400.1 hypothetical protein L198_07024 [Cryptococcus wingfieldii CBS 7118]
MSLDLSTFSPNSRHGNFSNAYTGHMCYCPMHLDLSAPKNSVGEWVGSGRPLTPGDPVQLVTFEDGKSTFLCGGCGVSAVRCSKGDPDDNEMVVGTVTRKTMETARIYEDYRNTFEKAVSVVPGYISPEGEIISYWVEATPFKIDRDTMTDPDTVSRTFSEFAQLQTVDKSNQSLAEEWWYQDWENDSQHKS